MPHRAGFWIRTVAAAIDLVALLVIYIAVMLLVITIWRNPADVAKVGTFLFCLCWLLYTSLEIWAAATPGKLLLGLRIRNIDGSPADFWRKFFRWSTKQLPQIAGLIYVATDFMPLRALGGFESTILLAGCFFAANDDHLTWHDQWAQTAVCWKRSRTLPLSPPISTPAQAPAC